MPASSARSATNLPTTFAVSTFDLSNLLSFSLVEAVTRTLLPLGSTILRKDYYWICKQIA